MKEYVLESKLSKSVVEREFWSKGEYSFTIDQHYRWLELFVTCDEKPVIDVDNIEQEGINIIEYLENKYPNCQIDNNIFDCYASTLTEYSNNIPEDLLDKITVFSDYRDELYDDGWDYSYTEIWIYSDMTVLEK